MDGSVTVDGIDLVHTALHRSEMFWSQPKFAEFDVSEMSFSSLIKAIAGGNDQWVGIPVFTTHHFFQNWIVIRKGAGIERPEDMAGKIIVFEIEGLCLPLPSIFQVGGHEFPTDIDPSLIHI